MAQLTLDGAELHYELVGRQGAGRPNFAFVHGGCCAMHDWDRQVEALRDDARVLTVDLRGHGRSSAGPLPLTVERWARDLNLLLEALALGPVVLTGHSLSSRIVSEAAWRRPDQVAALVLLDGSRTIGGFATSGTPLSEERTASPPSFAEIIDRTVGPYADAYVRRHVTGTMSSAPPALMQATAAALEDWDRLRADIVYSGLDASLPVLAIQSTYHDRFTPRRSFQGADETSPFLEFLRYANRRVQIRILPRTGHFSMLEAPGDVTNLIRSFNLTTQL